MTKLGWKKTEHFHRHEGTVPHYTAMVGPALLTCKKDPYLNGYDVSVSIVVGGNASGIKGHINYSVGCWKYLKDAKREAEMALMAILSELEECVMECGKVFE